MTRADRITARYGAKYEATRHLDIAEVAKLVRADIKAARAAGALGELPPSARFTVKISRFSMGQSIDIRVRGLPDEVWALDSEKSHQLGRALAAILDAYNYDRSDPLSDYYDRRFWAGVLMAHPRGGWRSIA